MSVFFKLNICLDEVDENCLEVFGTIVAKCKKMLPAKMPKSDQDNTDGKSSKQIRYNELINSFITCEICQEVFKDPKMLPCNHTFCKICLEKWKTSRNNSDFTCPKCRIICKDTSIETLPSDFKANQFIDALKTEDYVLSKPSTSCSNLAEWFKNNTIPEDIQKILVDEGFDSLELISELKPKDLESIPGLKSGHRLKLQKSIEKSQPKEDDILEECDELHLDSIYDDRTLTTGTTPVDTLKFWSGLSSSEREEFLINLKKLATKIKKANYVSKQVKANKLHRIAMVLCDAGLFSDAEIIAIDSMTFAKPDSTEYYSTNVLLLYALMNRVKQNTTWIGAEQLESWKNHLAKCDDVLKKGGKFLSDAMKCKVMIMKLFAMRAIKARDR